MPVDGGSFSGKDLVKVDRSEAYVARKIAVDYLKKYKARKAREVLVRLAYAIGQKDPLMKFVIIDGKEEEIRDYDLTPRELLNY